MKAELIFICFMLLLSAFIKERLGKLFSLPGDSFSVFCPERQFFGDYTTNLAFILAKQRKTSPFLIAEDIKKELEENRALRRYFEKIEVRNGYLNFFLSERFLKKTALQWEEILKAAQPRKKSKTVVIDFSSPNIGKTLSVAHIRSTIIGESLARIYEYLGWKVIRDNHLGDWGMIAGRLIAAYKKFSRKKLKDLTIDDLYRLYVKFTTAEKENPALTEYAKQETVKLQQYNQESLKIWKVLVVRSVKEYSRLYKILGVRFDYQHGESYYHKLALKLIGDFLKKGIAQEQEGAIVVPLDEFNLPKVVIQKADEASLYATNDLATAIFRYRTWKPDLVLYVVANEQALYFEQLFAVIQKYNLVPKGKLVHVKFGLIRGADNKKFSTRRGKMIKLDTVIQEAIRRAERVAKAKNKDISNRKLKKIAQAVGVGAIKYNDLSQNRNTDIVFDWDRMLSLEGNSAPYLLYTYARLESILRKSRTASHVFDSFDLARFGEPELKLMRLLVQFPEVVYQAAQEYLPNLIANYLFMLSSQINAYYEQFPVIKATEEKLRWARTLLVRNAGYTLKTGLSLLGIPIIKKI